MNCVNTVHVDGNGSTEFFYFTEPIFFKENSR